MNINSIVNAQNITELIMAIDDFCSASYLREDDEECMQLKETVENETENDNLMLLASYFAVCEDGDEIIEALYEFASNCRGFVAADEELTHQVTKEEFETVLSECEDKCALKSCMEDCHVLKTAEVEFYNTNREFGIKFKNDNINLILPRIDINTDVRRYISEELGAILYCVLKTKMPEEHIRREMFRYIPEIRQSEKTTKQLFREYFYDVVLYKDRKPGIFLKYDEHMKRVIVLEFFKKIIGKYLKE